MLIPLPISRPQAVADVLEQLGRTEDVAFSPDGTRLAIAAFAQPAVIVVDFHLDTDRVTGQPTIVLTNALTVTCASFGNPHGLAFADNFTLVVASRGACLVVIPVPPTGTQGPVDVRPMFDLMGQSTDEGPSSLTTVATDIGLIEVLVCSNEANTVFRYLVDMCAGRQVPGVERLLHQNLKVPDGVTMSSDGAWIAVSNHETHEVLIFRNDLSLDGAATPVGRLRGMGYPHGVCFADNDRYVLVTDAGAPHVHVFFSDSGWEGNRSSTRVVEVMNDDTYQLGHYNDREGGPKGLDVYQRLGLVAVTSHHQGIEFFSLAQFTGADHLSGSDPTGGPDPAARSPDARGRAITLRTLARLSEAQREIDELNTLHQTCTTELDELRALHQTRTADLDELRALRQTSTDDLEQAARTATSEQQAARRAEDALRLVVESRTWRATTSVRVALDWFKAQTARRRP